MKEFMSLEQIKEEAKHSSTAARGTLTPKSTTNKKGRPRKKKTGPEVEDGHVEDKDRIEDKNVTKVLDMDENIREGAVKGKKLDGETDGKNVPTSAKKGGKGPTRTKGGGENSVSKSEECPIASEVQTDFKDEQIEIDRESDFEESEVKESRKKGKNRKGKVKSGVKLEAKEESGDVEEEMLKGKSGKGKRKGSDEKMEVTKDIKEVEKQALRHEENVSMLEAFKFVLSASVA